MCLALEYVDTAGCALLSRVDGSEGLQLLTTCGSSVFRHKRRNSKLKGYSRNCLVQFIF